MNIQPSTPGNVPSASPLPSSFSLLWPAWLFWLLPPLPVVLFWHTQYGRFIALGLFFASCTSFVAGAFAPDLVGRISRATKISAPEIIWRSHMLGLSSALLFQWMIFSTLCLVFNDAHDIVAVILALGSLIPSLALAPWFMLATRKPFAAVVLTLFLVGSMKIAGCVIVVMVHGWHADAQGYTTLPWTHPNLLVRIFLLNTSLLSLAFCALARRRFIHELGSPVGVRPLTVRC